MKQVTDTGAIEKAIDAIIAANPDKVEQAKAKPTLLGWFVGQTMKATGRQGQSAGRQRPPADEARNRVMPQAAAPATSAVARIRPARDDDAQDLFGLLALCFADYPGCYVDPHEDLRIFAHRGRPFPKRAARSASWRTSAAAYAPASRSIARSPASGSCTASMSARTGGVRASAACSLRVPRIMPADCGPRRWSSGRTRVSRPLTACTSASATSGSAPRASSGILELGGIPVREAILNAPPGRRASFHRRDPELLRVPVRDPGLPEAHQGRDE